MNAQLPAGVEPYKIGSNSLIPAEGIKSRSESDADEDFHVVRGNLQELHEAGSKALEQLSSLALQSDDVKAYDALTKMIQTLASVNGSILSVHSEKLRQKEARRKAQEVSKPDITPGQSAGTITNNQFVFSGTPVELSAMLAGKQQEITVN